MDDYFVKNRAILSPEEQEILKEKKVLVAGCGGLGGSVVELLAPDAQPVMPTRRHTSYKLSLPTPQQQ